ncbi:MAG TPA: MFS transporter [Azospirillaceae bacterium]|nr:MFS transporter [Azospirillaceae bacterium]
MPRSRPPIPAFAAASAGTYFADQAILAALPLAAAQAGAGPGLTGALVAVQAAAWLLVSLPAGALADRASRRTLMWGGAVLTLLGAALGAILLSTGRALPHPAAPDPLALGGAAFLASSGVVLMALSMSALLPTVIPPPALPRANARIELARATAMLAAPAIAGALVEAGRADAAFLAAAAGGLAAMAAVAFVPMDPAAERSPPDTPDRRPSLVRAVRAGAVFVAANPVLRGIALCAIFWNMAFFALTALFVPYATGRLGLDARDIGVIWSVYGAGSLAGALLAPVIVARVPVGAVLLFGPGVSLLAVLLLVAAPSGTAFVPVAAGFALFGFGPMLWLIVQTSLRQTITPPALMGRVGATVQFAIYGVRPLGALAAGALAASVGVETAIGLPVALFAGSLAAIAISGLGRMRGMPATADA